MGGFRMLSDIPTDELIKELLNRPDTEVIRTGNCGIYEDGYVLTKKYAAAPDQRDIKAELIVASRNVKENDK